MKYEFVITDGPGTLIDYGVIISTRKYPDDNDIEECAIFAACNGYSLHAEPCSEDCETGL